MATRIGNKQIDFSGLVAQYAEENPKYVSKDLDSILECGEVDTDCVLGGYLAEEIFRHEDKDNDDLCIAIVDFYCDQWADMQKCMEDDDE